MTERWIDRDEVEREGGITIDRDLDDAPSFEPEDLDETEAKARSLLGKLERNPGDSGSTPPAR